MNAQEVVPIRKGRFVMTGIAIIIALVVAACGNDTVNGQQTATPMASPSDSTVVTTTPAMPRAKQGNYETIYAPFRGTIESVWSELAGEKIARPEFLAGVNVEGPFYGPSVTAGNWNAATRVNNKCVAVFTKGMDGSNESLITNLYVESRGLVYPWAAINGSEGNVPGANQLLADFQSQCR